MGESWIVSNLNAALSTWNDKLAEIWSLLTESPQTFKGGQVWGVMTGIHGALQAIGYGLLVLFFAVGVMKTCGSFVEVKKPEHALKLFIRFALAKAGRAKTMPHTSTAYSANKLREIFTDCLL